MKKDTTWDGFWVLLLEKSTTQKVLSVIYNGDEYISWSLTHNTDLILLSQQYF